MMDSEHLFFTGGSFMWGFWIVLIVAVIFFIKNISTSRHEEGGDSSPLEILKKRYARGEIDDEEYERRCKKLEN